MNLEEFFNGLDETAPTIGTVDKGILGLGGALVGFAIVLVLIGIAIATLIVIANCTINSKAGEKWWKGLIPLYNSWIQTKIVGLNWWWFPIFVGILFLATDGKEMGYVPAMALCLVSFNYCYNLCKKFGKSNGFAVLCTLLPFIGLPIIAFGSAKYNKEAKVDPNGIFSLK